ncbi:MAG: hypothetical protein ACTHJ3_11825 [Pararhizobium sp.]
MNGIIYLVGLVVIVLAILSFLGLRCAGRSCRSHAALPAPSSA